MMMKSCGLDARVAASVETADRRTDGGSRAIRCLARGDPGNPVRIFDISLGGCFVHAMHEQERGWSSC